ncbi:MAG: hypothetical protein QOE31_3128 [Solirubrobacteraceae bacterium]|jgi:hypothetical protein|nr:hypothetical protein [Solirubrobacteraceae bacterium]
MTEPAEPRPNPRDITRLLYEAVTKLPKEQQAAVFEYFLELGIGAQPPAALQQAQLWARGRGVVSSGEWPATVFAAQKGAGPNQQIIPVRLSEESHRRLKQWCADHDFHMSVVVRGLIERFLDGWQEPDAGGPAPGS